MQWGAGAAPWPSGRSRALDVALAISAAIVDGLLPFAGDHRDFWLPRPGMAVAAVLLGLLLVIRRRRPVLLAVVAIGIGIVTGVGFVAFLIVFYSLGAYEASRRVVVTLTVLAIAASVLQPEPGLGAQPLLMQLIIAAVFVATPMLLGLYMGARKQLLASLQERTRRLERERTLLAERARVEERARIAREMHDVVANRVSVMVVHAGALKAIAARDPDRAAETAAVIGEMGRQALDELRQVIGVLRLGDAAEPLTTPAPADFHALVEQSGAAGLPVDLTMECEDGTLPPAIARTAYRVVQEALTNVHKHAGDAATTVRLRQLPGVIEMLVRNAPPPERGPDHGLPSGGNGLLGLRERVTALGGSFHAGHCDDGGFEVRARIPLPSQEA